MWQEVILGTAEAALGARGSGRRAAGWQHCAAKEWEPVTSLQLLLVHKAGTGPSHNFPAAWLGNIFGNRNVTAAEICTLPSLLIKIADETFVRVGCLAKYRNTFLQCEDEHQGSWHGIMSVKCTCNECLLSKYYPPHHLRRC